MAVASTEEDKKISLWPKSGQSMGIVPLSGSEAGDDLEPVASLCWQRSKLVTVNENNCTAETALLGGVNGDSVLMPDLLPSIGVSSFSSSATFLGSRPSSTTSTSGSVSTTLYLSTTQETPPNSR